MHVTVISMCETYLKDKILEAITTYPHYAQVKKNLQKNNIQQKYKDYKMERRWNPLIHGQSLCS